MIINAHRSNVKNIGDLLSSPLHYYNFNQKTLVLDIHDHINKIELISKSLQFLPIKTNIIVGGGGLLDNEYFEESIQKLNNLKVNSIIYWGVGHNKHDDDHVKRIYPSTKTYLNDSSLYGVRDKLTGYDFLPCVSCMHPKLLEKYPVINDMVIFEHEHIPVNIDSDIPRMKNDQEDFSNVVEFLGSANYVITNSYHGMYWSILMGKKVVCIPFSSKFELFPFETPMGKESEIDHLLQQAKVHENAIDYCRELNNNFYSKVMNII